MSKVRVYEVAKQLNMDQKTLVAIFQSMGIGDVRNHMSAVESDLVERVKRHLERQKSPEVVEERIRPTVVKRRARVDAGGEGVPAPRPSSTGVEPATARGVPAAAPSQTTIARPAEPPPPAPSVPAARPSAPGRAAPAPAPSAPAQAAAPPPAPSAPAARQSTTFVAAPAASAPAAARSVPRAAPPSAVKPPVEQPAMEMFEPIGPAKVEHAAEPPKAEPAKVEPPKAVEPVKAEPAPEPVKAAEPPKAEPAPEPVKAAEPPKAVEPVKAEPTPEPVKAAEPPKAEPAKPAPAVAEPAKAEPAKPARPAQPAPAKPAQQATPSIPPPATPAATAAAARPMAAQAAAPARPAAPSTPPPPEAPRRPSSPPKTGVEVWQGRPGVPMPQQTPRTGPKQIRTTYDTRAQSTGGRPGPGGRPMTGPGGRPGGPGMGPNRFGPPGRMGPGGRPLPGMQNRRSGPAQVSTLEMGSHKKVIKIEEQVTLTQLAAKMSLKSTDVLMRLLSMGMTGVNINTKLDADTAKLLASEFGWTVEDVAVDESVVIDKAMGAEEASEADREQRPPIVTVMGHVDHGKTSLLDRIRKATVAEGEAGGITQHIGAYRVETSRGTIAFLDTPGHEAFTAMRARGASVTDIVILVVAADDGVMPQTREAIAHAQSAKVPIVVAVNKIDKPGSDPERIKRDLANLGLQSEEWGGDTMFAHVSAKTGQGIDQLLEAVLLQAEVLELRANPKKRAIGTVVEALLDRGRGPVARVMIQDGTLRTGDVIIAGSAWGKVRAMTDELGRQVREAGPSTPVEVLGLDEVPSAGDSVHSVKDAKTAEEIVETRRKKASKSLIPQEAKVSLEALTAKLAEADQLELKLIIKGDVQGSVEAVGHAVAKLSTQKVKVTIVHAGVGAITEGDVNLAVAAKAILVGFNVRPAGKAAALAESEGIEIRLYNIIYNAVDDIRSAMEGLLPATKIEKFLGRAEVRQVFNITKIGVVAGCMVIDGLIKRGVEGRLLRDNIVVWTGKLAGLRRFKDDAKEVAEGFECGISLDNYENIKVGDIIECFEIEEVKTKLS